jgi:kynurenine formamidase
MRLIDLSFTIEEGMPVYPGDMPTSIKRLDEPKIVEAGWLAHNITMSCHCGTHIESPAHSMPGGKMLNEYPLDMFFGPATTIAWKDIGHYTVETPILNLYSGYDQWWGQEKYFSPPPLTPQQAEWIGNLGIKILGSDIISVGDSTVHRIIQEKGILIVEEMCNLKEILYQKAELYLFPLKLTTEASPIRAVAKLP